MSSTILDHVSDVNGAELSRLAKLHEIPDFVKQADLNATRNPGDLPASVYGDPRINAYPCHNPASTFLSAMFFEEKKAQYAPKHAGFVRERIDKAVEYWSIKTAVDSLRKEWEEQHKTADDRLSDDYFAFVWANDDGTKARHCRMANAMETKTAAEWLHRHRDSMNFKDKQTVANKILEKAAQYGAGLGEYDLFIEKQAGRGVCNPKEVVAMLRGRAKLAKQAEWSKAINNLADLVATKPQFALDPNNLTKLAETVDTVDRANRLVGKYSELIPRPEDVLFKATFKEVSASYGSACQMTTGKVYDKDDFTKLALHDLQAAFGPDFAKGVQTGVDVDPEKLAEIASTLPRGDAAMFDELASAAGITPLPIKSASAETADLNRFADQY